MRVKVNFSPLPAFISDIFRLFRVIFYPSIKYHYQAEVINGVEVINYDEIKRL